ncbi:MAG: hypothetical protein Q9171_001060 [Xanthocarpia ochracea]
MRQTFDATCFRFDGAYPVLLNANLPPRPSKFNFVACSGDNFPTIRQKQLQPAFLRPRWGDRPEFVTLSMGGNDIGFKELVILCVYSIPNPLSPSMSCLEAIERSQWILNNDASTFVEDAMSVIFATLRQGGSRGVQNFKVYVTGYAQFFNERTTQCDDVSFRPTWLRLRAEEKLTTERRRTLNKIARDLNARLGEAVMRVSVGAPGRVFFINYDAQFEGHRFCDREEPNPNDAETWFLTYGADQAALGDFLNSIPQIRDLLSGRSNKTMSYDTLYRLILDAPGNDKEKRDTLVGLVRVFHPKVAGHMAIARRLRPVVLATRRPVAARVNGTSTS